jgi:hypothetical protein
MLLLASSFRLLLPPAVSVWERLWAAAVPWVAALACLPLEERREVVERVERGAAELSAMVGPSWLSKSMTILSPVDFAFLQRKYNSV